MNLRDFVDSNAYDQVFGTYRKNEAGSLVQTGRVFLVGRYVVMEFDNELESLEAFRHFLEAEALGKELDD